MTREEMDQATNGLPTKSAKIRALDQLGVTRAAIAAYLGIRYQFVRNVLVQPSSPVRDRPVEHAISAPSPPRVEHAPMTIEEAKLGLSAHFGVPPTSIEITIRG